MTHFTDASVFRRARRQFTRTLIAGSLGCLPWAAWSQSTQSQLLGALSATDATASVRQLLGQGADAAVAMLGQTDGFLGNPQVRIQMPAQLQQVAGLMRQFGLGAQVDEVEVAMNRAAEQAVPAGKDVLVHAIQGMTLSDAKTILTGGETAVTQFFAGRTREELVQRFTPIVSQATERVALAQKFDFMASQATRFGIWPAQNASLAAYVTNQTVEGLFVVIAQQERRLREDPIGAGTSLLTRVLGAMK